MAKRDEVFKKISDLKKAKLEEEEFFRELDQEDSDEDGINEEIEELLENLETFVIEEDNLDLFEIYTKYLKGYISAYNELPQLILKMVAEAKAISGESLLELIELIPYIHSGYLSISNPNKESSPTPQDKKDYSDE